MPGNHFTITLMDTIKVDETFRKAYIYSWTLRYGKTYQEWIEEKAKRIRDVLAFFHARRMPIDIQHLIHMVYRERLLDFGKLLWKPIDEHLTDHKPSAFIKSFTRYLIEKLASDGYLIYGWLVECHDKTRISDAYIPIEASTVRIYGIGIYSKIVELNDHSKLADVKVELKPAPMKVTRLPMKTIIELRDYIGVDDEKAKLEAAILPPKTKTTYMRRVTSIPSIEYLKNIYM